jgi:histone deacetylase 6
VSKLSEVSLFELGRSHVQIETSFFWQGYTPEDFRISHYRYSPESLYVCPSTPQAAELSCGGGIEAALAVARGEVRTAFAIIRPPGHHAEPERSMGFCFFSNIAVAARVVQRETPIKRILIVDWYA